MKADQSKWATALRMVRAASGLSQEQVAGAMYRDQVFASRVEAAKSVITPELVQSWVGVCGGLPLIDAMIRQLQGLRRMLEWLAPDPEVLMQV